MGTPITAEKNSIDFGTGADVLQHDQVLFNDPVKELLRKIDVARQVGQKILDATGEVGLFEMRPVDHGEDILAGFAPDCFDLLEEVGITPGSRDRRRGDGRVECFPFGGKVVPLPPWREDLDHIVIQECVDIGLSDGLLEDGRAVRCEGDAIRGPVRLAVGNGGIDAFA